MTWAVKIAYGLLVMAREASRSPMSLLMGTKASQLGPTLSTKLALPMGVGSLANDSSNSHALRASGRATHVCF